MGTRSLIITKYILNINTMYFLISIRQTPTPSTPSCGLREKGQRQLQRRCFTLSGPFWKQGGPWVSAFSLSFYQRFLSILVLEIHLCLPPYSLFCLCLHHWILAQLFEAICDWQRGKSGGICMAPGTFCRPRAALEWRYKECTPSSQVGAPEFNLFCAEFTPGP